MTDRSPETGRESGPIEPVDPAAIRIEGCRPEPRTAHLDPRGMLVETLRQDDPAMRDRPFAMSYVSVTLPGQFRDVDRWHVHQRQTDRFVVILGEMTLALWDGRPDSSTRGRLEVVRVDGLPFDRASSSTPARRTLHLIPIPPGVYHCIGNLGEQPFVLTNFPTRLYDPVDEGRVPFATCPVDDAGRTFGWTRVRRSPSSG